MRKIVSIPGYLIILPLAVYSFHKLMLFFYGQKMKTDYLFYILGALFIAVLIASMVVGYKFAKKNVMYIFIIPNRYKKQSKIQFLPEILLTV